MSRISDASIILLVITSKIYGHIMKKRSNPFPGPWRRLARLGAAAVWVHQGLWCKVLSDDPTHREVLASVPGLSGKRARHAATSLGLAETALAAVVVGGGGRRSVAVLQTAVVVAFNAGGLTVGRAHIERPARLMVRNAAFLALVWGSVDGRR